MRTSAVTGIASFGYNTGMEKCGNILGNLAEHTVLVIEEWKAILQSDSIAHDKLQAYESIGDLALRLFYDNGVRPSVAALIRDGEDNGESPQV